MPRLSLSSGGHSADPVARHDRGADTPAHSRGAERPKSCDRRCPRNRRGRRESRVPKHPQSCAKMHTADCRCAGTPGLPCAMVLRLIPRSPRSRIPLASVADGLMIDQSPVGPDNLHRLDTSNGCQDHTALPSAASSTRMFDRPVCCQTEVLVEAFKRRSSARRSFAHGPKPALRSLARPTLPRPSPPAPNVRDDRDTPLWRVRDGGVVGVIWGNREAVYFC
jgi:hypothetical protein